MPRRTPRLPEGLAETPLSPGCQVRLALLAPDGTEPAEGEDFGSAHLAGAQLLEAHILLHQHRTWDALSVHSPKLNPAREEWRPILDLILATGHALRDSQASLV